MHPLIQLLPGPLDPGSRTAPVRERVEEDVLNLPQQAEDLSRELFEWLRQDSLSALLAIGIGIAVYAVLVVGRRWARRRLAATVGLGGWGWVALKVVAQTRGFFLVAATARIIVAFATQAGAWQALVTFLFTVAAVVQAALWVRELLLALVERKASERDEDGTLSSALGVLTVIINVFVWAVAGIILLDNLGINVTALVAGLGIGGIAIGLAAQGIFSDLFAALSIILDRPFRVGETIQVGGPQGVIGTVEHIGLKTTRLRALSGEQVIMSNANLLNQQINNFAAFNERRVLMPIGVIYQTPVDRLQAIPAMLRAAVEERPRCRFDRANFTAMAPSSIDFELVFFVTDSALATMIAEREAVALAVLRRFEAEDIHIAYPTQVEMLAAPDGTIIDPRGELPAAKRQARAAQRGAGALGEGRSGS